MSDNNVVKSNKIAGWMDDFINTFANKDKKSNNEEVIADISENERTAEINLNDLPKVIWNDETYHVLIDDDGATIINGFGNTVTTLPGLKTLDEINNELNGKQIVSENINNSLEIDAEMEKEIEKALAYKDSIVTADETSDEQMAQDYVNNDPNANNNQSGDSNNMSNDNQNNNENNNQNTQQTAKIAEYMVGESLKQFEPFDYSSKMTELMDKKLNEFENKISEILNDKFDQILNEKLNELTNQFYSVTNDSVDNSIDDNIIIDNRNIITEPVNMDDINEEINNDIINDEELPSEEIEKFKEGICPFCGSELVKENIDDDFAHIGCSNCDVKYKVDLNNEKIYIE